MLWRSLAQRAEDVQRLLSRQPCLPNHCAAMIDHLTAASKASRSLPKAMQELHGIQVQAWASSFHLATKSCSPHWLTSLKKLATIKAAALEAITEKCRQSEWQVAIGAKAKANALNKAMPTKLAYRWMRGPVGWQTSTTGPAHLNECIPQEPDEHQTLWVESEPFSAPEEEGDDIEMEVLADQAAVEHEANQWEGTLEGKGGVQEPNRAATRRALPALNATGNRRSGAHLPHQHLAWLRQHGPQSLCQAVRGGTCCVGYAADGAREASRVG